MLSREMMRRPTVEDILHIPQLRVILAEIKCKIHEAELGERKARLEKEMSRREKLLTQREKQLKEYESRLQERESELREREKRLGSLQNYSHPQVDQNKSFQETLPHIPHLIDDAPREHSPRGCMDQYPNMYTTHNPATYNAEYLSSPPSDYHSHAYENREAFSRRRKYLPMSVVNHGCASPTMEYSSKRQRMNENRIFEYRHDGSMSPKLHCPAVSYEDYYFRRSRS